MNRNAEMNFSRLERPAPHLNELICFSVKDASLNIAILLSEQAGRDFSFPGNCI